MMRIAWAVSWLLCAGVSAADAETRRQDFATDPGWEGVNNRGSRIPCRTTAHDFGYSPDTHYAGGARGEAGGFIQMAADPTFYALRLPKPLTFRDRISASGKIAFPDPNTAGAFLLGFFNADTAMGWRTRNTLAMRLDHRGGDTLHVHMEYCTDRWRAGGGFIGAFDAAAGKNSIRNLRLGGVHEWSFDYDPDENDGGGSVTFALDRERTVMNLDAGHKADGALYNRFGLLNVMKSSDNRVRVYCDDLTINGHREDFSGDPGWEELHNHREFEDCIVRPRCDFGFSPTSFAGGAPGELGGLVFRGDSRDPLKLAYYGDRLAPLTLQRPLQAAGRVALTRGISDSTVLFGWFHSVRSHQKRTDDGLPRHFVGIMIEGPSSEGFYFRPAVRTEQEYAYGRGPIILPDGRPHHWRVRFQPQAEGGGATLSISLDAQTAELKLSDKHKLETGGFNRFGIITTLTDGNYQFVYFDDLEYTVRQGEAPSTRP